MAAKIYTAHHVAAKTTERVTFWAGDLATTDQIWAAAREAMSAAFGHADVTGWTEGAYGIDPIRSSSATAA